MNLFLHICCGPCATYPLAKLRQEGIAVNGYFYNPNIHPYREFKKRIEGVQQLAEISNLKVEIETRYGLTEYLREVVFHEHQRCPLCYAMRLEVVAQKAKERGDDAFSTTLLYSKYQDHEGIRRIGERLALKHEIEFYYEDFREGWKEGIEQAIAMDLYRQPYCGCIYSEQERYDKAFKKYVEKIKL
ncbi:MAG: epoxyqueuosine reductase QueH [Proteobacteria bacterium]|nr:epoxyqueuosine reductase QueH [Pseudomonadota bacterium]MBU1648191.1 epoxyqueuosine reductase QueH [Pseudomonadota bacterium]